MKYDDVIGQAAIKARLRRQVVEGRVPHAQLFCGPTGVGKLPVALALASVQVRAIPISKGGASAS